MLAILGLAAVGAAQAQSSGTDLLVSHARTFEFKDGEMNGEGVDWFLEKARASQFLVFGEQHNVTEIPLVTAALHDRLYEDGYHYLALEMGPRVAEALSTMAFEQAVAEHPFSIAFDNDADMEMVRRHVERVDDKGIAFDNNAIWGLDQAFSSLHLLKELIALAPNDEAETYATKLLKDAVAARREYIREDHLDDVGKLWDVFAPEPGSETHFLIDALESSMRMYTNWQKRETRYYNLSEREQYMKAQFMGNYREAQEAGVALPKVIVKLGGAHVMPGIGPNSVLTFGNFAEEFAFANGTESFTCGIWTKDRETLEPPYDALFEERSGVIIDFHGLRPHSIARQLEDIPEDLQQLILRYDAVILLTDTSRAEITFMQDYKRDYWRALRNRE